MMPEAQASWVSVFLLSAEFMRRADRLFRLVRQLQLHPQRTAAALASSEGVSVRTIYRDMEALSTSGVPLLGTPGEGYRLRPGWKLPALQFDIEQIEALMLGLSMTRAWGDPELRQAASEARERILSVLPTALSDGAQALALHAPDFHVGHASRWLGELRRALRTRVQIDIDYLDAYAQTSQRRVDPLGLFFWGDRWSLVGWCHLRGDFRHFRLDRIQSLALSSASVDDTPTRNLAEYLRRVRAEPPTA